MRRSNAPDSQRWTSRARFSSSPAAATAASPPVQEFFISLTTRLRGRSFAPERGFFSWTGQLKQPRHSEPAAEPATPAALRRSFTRTFPAAQRLCRNREPCGARPLIRLRHLLPRFDGRGGPFCEDRRGGEGSRFSALREISNRGPSPPRRFTQNVPRRITERGRRCRRRMRGLYCDSILVGSSLLHRRPHRLRVTRRVHLGVTPRLLRPATVFRRRRRGWPSPRSAGSASVRDGRRRGPRSSASATTRSGRRGFPPG